MRLYLFEHCSLCFRVRMTAALKRRRSARNRGARRRFSATMIDLVGKRVIPILVKDDGAPMLESMDMVAHIEGLGAPVLTGPQRSDIAAWAERAVAKTAPLTMPRYPLLGLPEFATAAAREHYIMRKHKTYGDFVDAARQDARADRGADARARDARPPDREPGRGQRHAVARRYSACCRCCAPPPSSKACAFRARCGTISKP